MTTVSRRYQRAITCSLWVVLGQAAVVLVLGQIYLLFMPSVSCLRMTDPIAVMAWIAVGVGYGQLILNTTRLMTQHPKERHQQDRLGLWIFATIVTLGVVCTSARLLLINGPPEACKALTMLSYYLSANAVLFILAVLVRNWPRYTRQKDRSLTIV